GDRFRSEPPRRRLQVREPEGRAYVRLRGVVLDLSAGSITPGPGVVYEHVAFDLDGTLVDSRADLTAAVNHVLAALGLARIDVATVSRYVGEGARVLVERALGPERQELVPRGLALFLGHYGAPLLHEARAHAGIP